MIDAHRHHFDLAYKGLEAQRWEISKNPISNSCMYRDPTGRKCAIGHMVDYRPEMDLHPWGYSNFQDVDMLVGLTVWQFVDIQALHDFALGPEDMKRRFDRYRDRHFS